MGAVHWTKPVDGPCRGHECDNCRICQTGHCCRKDDPEYTLPEVGTWTGSTYGELGKLDDLGDKVICHVCGGTYKSLPLHLWMMHDLTAAEYRAYFGLNRRTPLASLAVRQRLRESLLHTVAIGHLAADGHERIARAQAAQLTETPEQRRAWQSRKQRLEHRLSEGQVAFPCPICGAKVTTTPHKQRVRTVVTCGRRACQIAWQSRVQTGTTATPETRLKMSAALKGIPKSAEWRAKLSAAQKRLLDADPDARRRLNGATVAAAFNNRKTPIVVQCVCGKSYSLVPGRAKYRQYCSRSCAAKHRIVSRDEFHRFVGKRSA